MSGSKLEYSISIPMTGNMECQTKYSGAFLEIERRSRGLILIVRQHLYLISDLTVVFLKAGKNSLA